MSAAEGAARRRKAPYLLLLPSGVWLGLFFLIPLFVMASLSLQEGNLVEGFRQTFHWQTYAEAVTSYEVQIVRSLVYSGVATVAALVISFPMAYWIPFYGGSRKNAFLLLLLLPFFVSFVIRTLSWQFLLADEGIVLQPLKDLGLIGANFRLLATPLAVIAGLTYNFLPFMALPLYVSLERLDHRLVEAAGDLYASRTQAFVRVIVPLAVPGIFAGVLLTFIPASADFLNAQILGGVGQTMIGTIIETQFMTNNNYPLASALSFLMMALLLIGVFVYARALGTERIQEYA